MRVSALAMPWRGEKKPRGGGKKKIAVLWTNEGLEKLGPLGAISIVGQPDTKQGATATAMPAPYDETQDPEWYAERAAKLRDALERRQAQLTEYQQALKDARSLKETAGGINLDDGDIGITPAAG